MTSQVLEELPLIRAKGEGARGTTEPTVGPGSYELNTRRPANASRAPFDSTSTRGPVSLADPSLPGPGTYNIGTAWGDGNGAGVSRPFVSESSRFDGGRRDETPGPGAYDVSDRRSSHRNPRAFTFSGPNQSEGQLGLATSLGPGSYTPNYAAAERRVPRGAGFAKYSGRTPLRPAAGPGPGSYDSLLAPRTITDAKPSSMFVTKTKRTICGGVGFTDTPGPGTYNIGHDPAMGGPRPQEHFSAFGTNASRFVDGREAERAPGPGTYAADFAPRRFAPLSGPGSAAFVSAYDRFPISFSDSAPGPGTYDARRPRRHDDFGSPAPFSSTVPRFNPVWSQHPLSEPLVFSGDSYGGHAPRRGLRRPFVQRQITPSSAPPPLPDRVYDVRYEWPKVASTANSTFGFSKRPAPSSGSAADAPGPGSYAVSGGVAASGPRFGNSAWGRDVRFADTLPSRTSPDPGKYYHSSTFLTKSHNATIGSDTTWIG